MNNFLREALDLARRGKGQTSPNPAVGAVLVRDAQIVGSGYHTWAGVKHAEIQALEQAGERARGAALYINLEPCSHQGRTGPCADALIEAGVKRVVAAMQDPNPLVRERAADALNDFSSDPNILQWLRYVAENDADPAVRRQAFRALGKPRK